MLIHWGYHCKVHKVDTWNLSQSFSGGERHCGCESTQCSVGGGGGWGGRNLQRSVIKDVPAGDAAIRSVPLQQRCDQLPLHKTSQFIYIIIYLRVTGSLNNLKGFYFVVIFFITIKALPFWKCQ